MAQKFLKALGIMNGTSIDAVDYALIKVNRKTLKPQFVGHKQKKIPTDLKKQLLLAATNQLTTYDLSHLNFTLGKLYATHVKALKKDWSWEVIGVHGQTVHHEGGRATLQIGTPAYLRNLFKGPVISDFRSQDVASGGEGAPFAPFFQRYLVDSKKVPFAFHNLGGISNLTLFTKKKVIAFDTGPANILIDAWIKKVSKGKKLYDDKGKMAAKGLYDPQVLAKLLKFPYFKQKPPKSCGREEFNLAFIQKYGGAAFNKLSPEDQLATLTELSARTIAEAYQVFLPKKPKAIYFYGGGVHNTYLMERLQYNMPETTICMTDELSWPSQAFEASLIAFLAAARVFERPVHLPEVTGAQNSQILGLL